eukprot:2058603-Prymnesium_polylepis.1
MQNQTLEQIISKMQTSHLALLDTMMDNLRLGVPELPPSVLEPLELAKKKAEAQGKERTFFNKPQNYMQATQAALNANDACYAALATDAVWLGVKGDDA